MVLGHLNNLSKFIFWGKNALIWEFLAGKLEKKSHLSGLGTPPENGVCLIRQKITVSAAVGRHFIIHLKDSVTNTYIRHQSCMYRPYLGDLKF